MVGVTARPSHIGTGTISVADAATVVVLCQLFIAAAAVDFYVAVTGVDSPACSLAAPCATLGAAVAAAASVSTIDGPSDQAVIHIGSGTYSKPGNCGVTVTHSVTIVGAGANATTLDCALSASAPSRPAVLVRGAACTVNLTGLAIVNNRVVIDDPYDDVIMASTVGGAAVCVLRDGGGGTGPIRAGRLDMRDVSFRDNVVVNTSAAYSAGGAVLVILTNGWYEPVW